MSNNNISNRKNKKRKKFTLKHYLIILFSFPLLVSIIIAYFVFGNLFEALIKMFELRGNPNVTKDAVTSLSYIWTLLITIYGIGITAIFSYLVWKVSERSLEVSKDIKQLEETRDSEQVREQALIVYYDIQRGITYLRDLYISTVINKESPNPKRLYFSDDWIKNVASIRNDLSSEKLTKVYDIYNDFFTIQSLLDSQSSHDDISSFVKSVAEKMFADFVPLPLLKHFKEATPDDLLNIDLYIILQQVYLLTFSANQISEERHTSDSYTIKINGVNHYTVKKGEKFDGEGILYTPYGYEKAIGHFGLGEFATGRVIGYLNSNGKLFDITYETTSSTRKLISGSIKDPNSKSTDELHFMKGQYLGEMIHTGITTLYTSEGIITFRGKVFDGIREGLGNSYDPTNGQLYFSGIYKNNDRFNGKLFKNGKEVFNGEFKYRKPWNGEANNLSIPQRSIIEYSGKIEEGKPFNGFGYKYRNNEHGESFEEIRSIENYNEDFHDQHEDVEYISREINNQVRQEYEYWDEYIMTDWTKGKAIERQSIESNIKVIGNR